MRGFPVPSTLCACIAIVVMTSVSPDRVIAQIGGEAGAFSRLGFAARGIGMGNAMTAVTTGDLAGYYNPALLPWSRFRQGSATFGVLSLDRSLNFLSYSQPVPPNAGISVGIINAGVSNIDGRDANGDPTGPLRTSENEISLGFGARLKSGLSLGINVKLLYYHLYTDIASTTAGVDFGLAYTVRDVVTIGATVRDFGSRYKWNTSNLYGDLGGETENDFPQLYTLGLAWMLPDSIGTVAADLEFSSVKTMIGRLGVEVPLIPELTVRAGVDRIDLKESGNGVRPAFGFTARKDFNDWTPAVEYAFVLEPFAPNGMHIISISVRF